MQTNGVSPKVIAVIVAIGGPGLVVLILGLVLGDSELRAAGLALLLAAVGGGGAGYHAPAGETTVLPKPDANV
jgi:hypothetical protein